MIKYNLKYRGPFEYDKIILNVFQISNESKLMLKKLESDDFNVLKENADVFQSLFNDVVGENGLLNSILKLKLKIQ